MDLLGEWGFDYDVGQLLVISSSLREQPDGRWAAKEVGVEEPRQNGKGEIIEGRECLGLFYLGERKLIHSAHEFATASEALDRMDDRIGQNPKLKQLVRTVKRSHGEEGVYLKDGRKLLYKTRTKGAGRGFSADFLGMDEAMYIAEAFLGALMPVISARPNPQIWYMGSAVDQKTMDNGVVFARLRRRALEHAPGRMAYFGWSAAYEDGRVIWHSPADVSREVTADPGVIARANPALGIRIDLEHVLMTEREAMSHDTFCVERLGVGDWPSTDEDADRKITKNAWASCLERAETVDPAAIRPICLAFDVSPDRSSSAVGVVGQRADGKWVGAVVRHGSGTHWVVDELKGLAGRHDPLAIVWDRLGQANSLADGLEQAGIANLKPMDTRDVVDACGMFFDSVTDGEFVHIGQPELDSAVDGAAERVVGEAWAWGRRKSSVDITPLVVVTLARWGAETQREKNAAANIW